MTILADATVELRLLGTVSGLHLEYKTLSKAKRRTFRAHLTLLDIDHSILARDLCVLMLLHALNSATNATARAEIKATLMYTFCGAVMPSYCYERLQTTIGDLRRRLAVTPPDLPPWLHVVTESIPAIVGTLEHWSGLVKSTRKTLECHTYKSKLDVPDMSRMNDDMRRTWQARVAKEREESREFLLSATDTDLIKWGYIPARVPPAGRRRFLQDNIESVIDEYQKQFPFGKVRPLEDLWYKELKVLLPPEDLRDRHPDFDIAWAMIATTKELDPRLRRKAAAHINEEWKPNVTLFAPKYSDPKRFPDGDGYPMLDGDILLTAAYLDFFNRRSGPYANKQARHSQWILTSEACGDFFDEVAAALKGIGNRITLEILWGGLSEELNKMVVKADVSRPREFPRKYMRMWLSNVPDYVHGPMNTIVYNLPNLRSDDTQAVLAFNCMANTGVFVTDDDYFHTYTLLPAEEIRRYMGCEVMHSGITSSVVVLRSLLLPRPLTELATQDELKTWLTRVLFNTFLPARSKLAPSKVHAPHNLVAFFGLLFHLHRVGYPSHWLADFLSRVLSGSMHSDVAPYLGVYPIPLSERTRRVQLRRVRTDPWLVEFETIIATAYYCIPFSLSGALPNDFSRTPSDIAVWEAQVSPAEHYLRETMFNPALSPYDTRTHLLFYRSDVISARDIIDSLPHIFEGKASPAPGSFFILTAQEHVQYQTAIRFRLSRVRVARMRTHRWSMVAYRNDTRHQVTLPAPIGSWALVGSDSGMSDEGQSAQKPSAYERALEELD